MAGLFATLARLVGRDGAAALVSVLETRGSTPREVGARMLVGRDADIFGTIGGGRLEREAVERARQLTAAGVDTAEPFAFALGPSLGQCCGGHVTLLVEVFTAARFDHLRELAAAEAARPAMQTEAVFAAGRPAIRHVTGAAPLDPAIRLGPDGLLAESFGRPGRPVFLFGAGHVGKALVLALAPLPFAVTWIDSRPEVFIDLPFANLDRVACDRPSEQLATAPDGAFVVVMTHDHGLDLDILDAALRDGRFPFIGVIGSRTKRARFESRLRTLGFDAARAGAFVCPLGVPGISSKEPAVIAAALAAQLLIEDQRLKAGEGSASRREAMHSA